MSSIPVIGFAAWSGTGKTTLVEKLVVALKARGYRVAVVKHDVHGFEIDKAGKDSWRFAKAGADMTLISSGERTAIIEQRPRSFAENLSSIHDVDLILVEGYKQEDIPKIGINRRATGKGFPHSLAHYIAVVTDEDLPDSPVPVFGLEDVEALVAFLLEQTGL